MMRLAQMCTGFIFPGFARFVTMAAEFWIKPIVNKNKLKPQEYNFLRLIQQNQCGCPEKRDRKRKWLEKVSKE